ncbi:FMRFamide receptor-like [Haliotis rubra]|uniref:FMRFamide receptor-like n=1 Tax=Haliotis rubra TaxID=36100 RepID=UPI001EE565E6|nr:FMRFamide receptor-like [Haliotis rubra]
MASVDNVDDEMMSYSLLPFFILGVVRIALACFGIIANIVSIRVLTHKSIWSATSILLISLVVYDTLFLLTGAVVIIAGLPEYEEDHLFITVTLFYPFRYISQMGSVYSIVAVTVERFIVVVTPLRARSIWTMNNARRVAIGVFIFSLGFNIPRCLVFHQLSSTDWVENGTLTQSDTSQDYLYSRVYEVYLTMVVFYILPYTIIIVINIKLIVHLRISARVTRAISSRHDARPSVSPTDKEDGLTIIVLGITTCFFVCCVIPLTYHILLLADLDMFSTPHKVYLFAVSDTMLCLNSATDFIFYCLLGRRFRRVFFKLFCPCMCGKRRINVNQN